MGTYGGNTRLIATTFNGNQSTPDEAESYVLKWFESFVKKMGSDLPDKFHLAGVANGGYQAGLYAAKNPDRIEKLLILSPSEFCP